VRNVARDARRSELGHVYSRRQLSGDSVPPQKLVCALDGGSLVASLPGALPGYGMFTAKCNTKMAVGPSVQGFVGLFEEGTGKPLGLFESGCVTALRTAAATVLGIQRFAVGRPRVGIVGAGRMGRALLDYLLAVVPVAGVGVYDIREDAMQHPAWCQPHVRRCASVDQIVGDYDVTCLFTTSRTPVIFSKHIRPGIHIAAFGADEPGKVEVAADVWRSNNVDVIVDDFRLNVSHGSLAESGFQAQGSVRSI